MDGPIRRRKMGMEATASSGLKTRRPNERPQVGRRPIGPQKKICQTACKPGFVPPRKDGDDHSSGPSIAERFSRPTRTSRAVSPARRTPHDVPIWSCSRRGLPCRPCRQVRGGLLPHPFTLAAREREAVCFLWRYPSGRPGRKLSAAFSPWSPDFPRRTRSPPRPPGRLAGARCAARPPRSTAGGSFAA